jgi:hypothetical protein
MKRMITKQSTVTPMSTKKGKSMGSGVANMGTPMGKIERTSTEIKKSPLAKPGMPSFAMEVTKSSGNKRTSAGAGMPRFAMERTVTKKTTKPKAKMLPEVKVTAPKPQKRFALKITSRKKG